MGIDARTTTPTAGGDCPKCGSVTTTVDSRPSPAPDIIRRRRRKCFNCEHRFTTHEVVSGSIETGEINQQVKAREFIRRSDALIREIFGDGDGYLTSARGTRR